MYFVRKVLQVPKVRSQELEKLAYNLIVIARRFHLYFESHHIIMKTKHLIKQVLRKLMVIGRIIA